MNAVVKPILPNINNGITLVCREPQGVKITLFMSDLIFAQQGIACALREFVLNGSGDTDETANLVVANELTSELLRAYLNAAQ